MDVRAGKAPKENGQVLSDKDLKDFKRSSTYCYRLSHYPDICWHKAGRELGRTLGQSDNGSAALVVKSAGRIVEGPDNKYIYKNSFHTHFAIKCRSFMSLDKAENFAETNRLAMRVPYAKIKAPAVIPHRHGDYEVTIVMEELSGRTLANLLFEEGDYDSPILVTWSADQRLQIMLEVALNLQSQIHASGIIHRDITPANVMVNDSVSPPIVRIFDFDHCKLASQLDDNYCGTPLFMPPEAFQRKNKTEKTDVFGLAWLFYFILDGKRKAITTHQEAEQAANAYQPIGLFASLKRAFNQDEQEALSALLKKMFHPDQKQRCMLQYCIDVIETMLLSRNCHKELRPAYLEGKQLRLKLYELAIEHSVGDDPHPINTNVINLFKGIKRWQAPDEVSAFLAGLRVNCLNGLTSLDGIKQKVSAILADFSNHLALLRQLQAEIDNDYQMPLSDLKQSVDYFLDLYTPFFWSLDNLVMIDRKLVKMAARAEDRLEEVRKPLRYAFKMC